MPLDKFGRHASRSRAYHYDDAMDVALDGDDDEYLHMRNRRIIQVAPPINDSDVVNKKFLEEQLGKVIDKLNEHIQKAETTIQKANDIILDVTTDIKAIFKHLKIN